MIGQSSRYVMEDQQADAFAVEYEGRVILVPLTNRDFDYSGCYVEGNQVHVDTYSVYRRHDVYNINPDSCIAELNERFSWWVTGAHHGLIVSDGLLYETYYLPLPEEISIEDCSGAAVLPDSNEGDLRKIRLCLNDGKTLHYEVSSKERKSITSVELIDVGPVCYVARLTEEESAEK